MPPPPSGSGDPSRDCANAGKTVSTEQEAAPDVTCSGGKRRILCYGAWAAHCGPDDKLVSLTNCRADGQVCAMRDCASAKDCNGCQACTPGSARCGQDGARMLCRDDGSGFDEAEPCDESAGLRCSLSSGQCEDLCAAAESQHSYIGCDYWAVPTSNSQLDFESVDANGLCRPFSFAVVVANAEGVSAHVTVESPGRDARTVTVEPSSTATIELPCEPELKGGGPGSGVPDGGVGDEDAGSEQQPTVLAKRGAHHITSDVPVTVYQFNPLEFESESADGTTAYSYTNDASLLLPTHSLSGDYVVMAQPTLLHHVVPNDDSLPTITHSGPGFVAIVGVEADPTEVEIVSSAYTRPSKDGSIPALSPGGHLRVSLSQGEVLQLLSAVPPDCPDDTTDSIRGGKIHYCKVGRDYDLTGTQITAQGKVSVIAGHDCAFLPYNRWACDHLEESIFPLQSWGKDIAVSVSETVACQPTVPNLVRVLSGSDRNQITFTPAVHDKVLLDKGELLELEVSEDFRITAAYPIMVGQFLLGQDYNGRGSSGSFAKGDPSMSLAIPSEQWRTRYPFLTPETYTDNYINVIARTHQLVLLDGRVVTGFAPIEGTSLSVSRIPLDSGQHVIEAQQGFGIVLYGYAPYTSYMMPGGLDLNPINPLL